jgi:hypothetical protein
MFEGWINDFAAWLKYVEGLPHYGGPNRSLDRIENDKNYEPDNLRWATKTEQANNRRSNVLLTFRGETHTATEWGKLTEVTPAAILQRLKRGWSVERTLTTPLSESKGGRTYSYHGQRSHKLYHTWSGQKDRCLNQNSQAWVDYGGRGITMHAPWVNDFISWLKYVESLPHYGEPDRTLDRADNDKGYAPGNLRWATREEQAGNQRGHRLITRGSETHSLAEWGRITGIPKNSIGRRLSSGWPIDRALSTPIKTKGWSESDLIQVSC